MRCPGTLSLRGGGNGREAAAAVVRRVRAAQQPGRKGDVLRDVRTDRAGGARRGPAFFEKDFTRQNVTILRSDLTLREFSHAIVAIEIVFNTEKSASKRAASTWSGLWPEWPMLQK